ncbi:MAG: WYL domain-containing protein [Alphaproteobacteria bacterium]|nr:WYL domain-containing protein [Alphaproteobacteria bacterium]MAS48437.1 WYL domain-containing protein [Alphaproteobacteria bacterium]MAX96305.1 WYL domain-containing protein [Alphaproteobacteria bacterium]MBN53989.1 WYL domain-containing protein [Alphaproteobacteria bacterium]OUT39103.1 MAG: hypothetical protein CBB62_11825 [Micavibrio sp. TMED2]|tara:strand:- start:1720 stop:2571 length:852 start_codon:yes stop_codon:yes gene_type:complete
MPPAGPVDKSETMRWTVEQRLAFIADRLAWEGSVNRRDLVEQFGISPNQATGDFNRFAEYYPEALDYDRQEKTYRPGPKFVDVPHRGSNELLSELRLIGEGILGAAAGLFTSPPEIVVAEAPVRPVPDATLAAVIAAIRQSRQVHCRYRSFSTMELKPRVLEPFALVFDGFRWHVRGFDTGQQKFRDFVLGRLDSPELGDAAHMRREDDPEWMEHETLTIIPHPGLTEPQRQAIVIDYGMSDGCLRLTPRKALAFYVKKRLGLLEGHKERKPEEQHIVLLNDD